MGAVLDVMTSIPQGGDDGGGGADNRMAVSTSLIMGKMTATLKPPINRALIRQAVMGGPATGR